MISPKIRTLLIQKAEEIVKFAYAPYSKFHVGAALITESDQIYVGCNVENASYGLTICAERNAIFSAIANEGPQMRLKAFAITSLPHAVASPCGACRQVMSEFCQDIPIIFSNSGTYMDLSLKNLLPHNFIFHGGMVPLDHS